MFGFDARDLAADGDQARQIDRILHIHVVVDHFRNQMGMAHGLIVAAHDAEGLAERALDDGQAVHDALALGDAADYIIESMIAIIATHNNDIVSVEIPASVELLIANTEPGIQGDRVSGARKPAELQTGKTIQVPLFVNIGDKVKVDTRSGEYLTRV